MFLLYYIRREHFYLLGIYWAFSYSFRTDYLHSTHVAMSRAGIFTLHLNSGLNELKLCLAVARIGPLLARMKTAPELSLK
jgi:hypothetical protein